MKAGKKTIKLILLGAIALGLVLGVSLIRSKLEVDDDVFTGADYTVFATDAAPEIAYTPVQSPTTGKWYYEGWEYKPVGVMIENQVACRPQSGLQSADIVYEANVEYSITRFLAIFNDNTPDFIGPIRSARVYFMRLQQQWNCGYFHFGGPGGDDSINIKGSSSKHIAQWHNLIGGHRGYWWREYDGSKIPAPYAPHNVFTTVERLQSLMTEVTDVKAPLTFSQTNSYGDSGKTVDSIVLHWIKGSTVTYRYDAEKDKLIRYSNSGASAVPHIDNNTGNAIEVQNLVVQYCKYSLHADGIHRIVTLLGSGKAEFFIGGKHITGTWSRSAYTEPTVYLDADGNEIVFTAGNTWIAIHPTSTAAATVTYAE